MHSLVESSGEYLRGERKEGEKEKGLGVMSF